MKSVAIIGGGINGLSTANLLSRNGFEIDLYEKDTLLSKTSSSSSKLLHGGIRYLEQGNLKLVRQSLLDRHWWLSKAPNHCRKIKMVIPIYDVDRRSALKLFFGAKIYEILSGRYSIGPSEWKSSSWTSNQCNELIQKGIRSSIIFYDVQMDEEELGKWMISNIFESGVKVFENSPINSISKNGFISGKGISNKKYDLIINATGPWAAEFNKENNIGTKYDLELVRGSHLIINKQVSNYYLLQEKHGNRIIFVMPYKGNTLIGTTEVSQSINEEIKCSDEEAIYLIELYNSYFDNSISKDDVIENFSGLRPIIKETGNKLSNLSIASRESVVETHEKVLTIYGGKWTSAPSLAIKVLENIKKMVGN